MMRNLGIITICALLGGCATYTTPGGPVVISDLATPEINRLMTREPAADFPANIAVVQIQASGYRSLNTTGFGEGRYSVVLDRNEASERVLQQLGSLEGVASIGPLNRLLLPTRMDSVQSLREAAAKLRADMLLLYTFDTGFQVGDRRFRPLNTVALGFLNNKKITVTTTASAIIYDVRTEYIYGLAEATNSDTREVSMWGNQRIVDALRIETEHTALKMLGDEIERTWAGIRAEHVLAASGLER
ncbi:MAG: hypothetical protein AAFQ99_07140 [Pseudomonadota bacterium]